MTFRGQVTKDIKRQSPTAICELTPGTVNRHVIVNRTVPPFDNADLRRAMALAIDRQAFIDILGEGKGDIGAVLQPGDRCAAPCICPGSGIPAGPNAHCPRGPQKAGYTYRCGVNPGRLIAWRPWLREQAVPSVCMEGATVSVCCSEGRLHLAQSARDLRRGARAALPRVPCRGTQPDLNGATASSLVRSSGSS
jgi:Bacterial extracellular solute-binding proteins, family 5 Middle